MADMIPIDPLRPQPDRIERAAALIRSGQVVGIPTDTVYGLATDAFSGPAALKVFALKKRPATLPLLILVSSVQMARDCAGGSSALFERLAQRFWPGPLTIVVTASPQFPNEVTAGTGTVGIRYPNSPVPLALINAVGGPITASSANLSGMPECLSAEDVDSSLGHNLRLILDTGPSAGGVVSTVVSVVDGCLTILREGAIDAKAIHGF